MQTVFFDNQDFAYSAKLNSIDALPGTKSLTISSRWRSAKNPDDEHLHFQATLDRQGLLALRALLDEALAV